MNIIDVIIILLILMCGVIGMKKGFVRTTISLIGIILVFIFSFYLKNPIAEALSLHLPFFSFTGSFKGATILNVIIYQIIAFIIIFTGLMFAYCFVVKISKILEKILDITFILAIPSKIGGFIVGILEGAFISLIAVVVLSLPILNFDLIRDSNIRKYLYNASPIVGNVTNNMNSAIDEIMDLKDKFKEDKDKEEFNLSCLDVLLKHKVITVSYAENIRDSYKLKIDKVKVQVIIDRYK